MRLMDDSEEPVGMSRWLLLNTLGITVFVFGLLLWGYSVTIQLTQPELLADTLTHHVFPPLNWRVDDVGIIGFAIAPFGFFAWIISRSRLLSQEREEPRLSPRNAPVEAVGVTDPMPVTGPETSASGEPMSKKRSPRRSNKRLATSKMT
jgi:hypothetical protein